jgi:hypothetical protein
LKIINNAIVEDHALIFIIISVTISGKLRDILNPISPRKTQNIT